MLTIDEYESKNVFLRSQRVWEKYFSLYEENAKSITVYLKNRSIHGEYDEFRTVFVRVADPDPDSIGSVDPDSIGSVDPDPGGQN